MSKEDELKDKYMLGITVSGEKIIKADAVNIGRAVMEVSEMVDGCWRCTLARIKWFTVMLEPKEISEIFKYHFSDHNADN